MWGKLENKFQNFVLSSTEKENHSRAFINTTSMSRIGSSITTKYT